MRIRTRGYAAAAGAAALALVVAACGGSSGGGSTSGTSAGSQTYGLQGLNPGSGTPTKGGTLNMLGQGDVDFMDYNVSYYTIGALGQRPWLRLLYAYPATPGKVTTVVPDLATALPTISNGGKTYTVTIRTGAMWDSSPPRQVTAADALLGLKRDCNPTQPFGGLPDFEGAGRRLPAVLQRVRQGLVHLGLGHQEVHRHPPDLGCEGLGADDHLQPGPPGQLLPGHAADGRLRARAGGKPELPAGERAGRPAHHRRRAVQDPELRAHAEHRLRPQPGVEGQHGPGPQGLRQRDQGLGDRQRARGPAAAADQHGRGRAWSSTRSRRSARTRACWPR